MSSFSLLREGLGSLILFWDGFGSMPWVTKNSARAYQRDLKKTLKIKAMNNQLFSPKFFDTMPLLADLRVTDSTTSTSVQFTNSASLKVGFILGSL